jgi:hypothetical protein
VTALTLNPTWLPNLFRLHPIHQEHVHEIAALEIFTNDSATCTKHSSSAAIFDVATAFETARQLDLEAGIDNEFRQRLLVAVQQHGSLAIDALETQMSQADPDIIAMALRYLGSMTHPTTYRRRLNLLIDSLFHSSPQVRDGAGLGLALLNEREAIPYLQRAIQSERIASLRADLQMVLDQLIS